VVLTNPSEKYESVGRIIPFPNEWKFIKAMFQSTNQHTIGFGFTPRKQGVLWLNLAHGDHSPVRSIQGCPS